MILAGDIGGTHTRLVLFDPADLTGGTERKYPSRNFGSLAEIVREFLGKTKVTNACFGIAGPVVEGRCQATNLPWIIDAQELSRNLGIPSVQLLNDLEANAYGLRMLKPEELVPLHPGHPGRKGNAALIAAGTGLGEAGIFWDGKEHIPFACEGGHSDFAPRDDLEIELFVYLKKKFGHVSYERVLSGPGIFEIYRFFTETGRYKASGSVEEEMKKKDPPRVISEQARMNRDPACVQAIDLFISMYGSEAGNLALKMLALDGVYIGGGIAPPLIEKMKSGLFYSSFIEKGRFRKLLESIPIWVIMNDQAALLGAAYFARRSA